MNIVNSLGLGNLQGFAETPENLRNVYVPPTKPRDAVTMSKPLEPWPEAISFHRTLALHIDSVTFAACGKGMKAEDDLSPWLWYPLCGFALLVFGLIVWRFV